MDPTILTTSILVTGLIVVVGGILVLRLHPFLALIFGALCVSTLTPAPTVERFTVQRAGVVLKEFPPAGDPVSLPLGKKNGVIPGMRFLLLRSDTPHDPYQPIGELEVLTVEEKKSAAEVHVDKSTDLPAPSEWLAIDPLAYQSALKDAGKSSMSRLAAGFGNTCMKIGILIAMASIIGKCLLDSGAADRIVRSALRLFGEGAAPFAFLTSGFVLAIPVFFDTVFYLMIPLGKAMRMRTGRNYLLYVMTIVAGGTMAHSLVPPTPGPLLVAGQLGVGLGEMILAGCIVGIFTSGSGYLFALFMNSRFDLPLRESEEFSLVDLQAVLDRPDNDLPPLWLSLVPILLPVVLIGADAIVGLTSSSIAYPGWLTAGVEILGDKNLSLVLAAVVAMGTLLFHKGETWMELREGVGSSLASGGSIILITAAGGAFGGVLEQTGVSNLFAAMSYTSPAMVVLLAFLVTTAIRTAQGSATVAMITAVGVLGGLATSGQLEFHPVYLALAIGCGSKPIAWMNDSGFWVISRMSGMTEAETLRTITPMSVIMGGVGLICTMVGATFFPFGG